LNRIDVVSQPFDKRCKEVAARQGINPGEKPVWVVWTLHKDRSGKLRSGETVSEATEILSDLPVSG